MDLAWQVHGHGPSTLTLLHGGLIGGRTWDSTAASVAEWSRVLTVDLPGYGASPPAPEIDDGELAQAILRCWDAAGVESSFVAGFSAGGMIAQRLAHMAAPRVDGLILISTCAGLASAGREAYAERATQIERAGLRPQVPALLERAFSPTFRAQQPELVAAYGREVEATGAAAVARMLRFVSQFDGRESLAHITAPALVVSGADDEGMPPAFGAELAAQLASSRHIVLPDAGHTLHLEQAGTIGHLLIDFVDSGGAELDIYRPVA